MNVRMNVRMNVKVLKIYCRRMMECVQIKVIYKNILYEQNNKLINVKSDDLNEGIVGLNKQLKLQ